ncbi:hypothetical protein EET67_20085 [Pseudaminobacter arsenicus]|uniref:UspA domain-containing protein n=1 Tax=Borborobacter arsenicus TaxID=1851146 RepID=A0A432V187_9HYPH|nr:universal stress protein [Pseudaminobacter arsenicus]RUM95974.1 hypothetical protein EET67_20085 [Pseudaminobacter arsenicus]
MYKHILIPTDGFERSEKAVAHGAALAAAVKAKVTVLTVTVPLHSIASDPTVKIPWGLDDGRRFCRMSGRSTNHLFRGPDVQDRKSCDRHPY